MFEKSKKLISMLIVFVIVFSYMGQTLEAVASTDGITAITNGFMGSEEMKFHSYFGNSGHTEKIGNVNEKMTLTMEIAPNNIGQGFLKEGTISASGIDESDINFKFSNIKNIEIDEPEEIVENINVENIQTEIVENLNIENDFEESVENIEIEEVEEQAENIDIEEAKDRVENIEIKETEEQVENIDVEELQTSEVITNQEIENNVVIDVTSRSSETRFEENQDSVTIDVNYGNELVNEEIIEIQATQETYEELTAKDFEIEVLNDNQIKVQNVIYNTKIEVELEYNKKDIFNITDLYKQINLKLSGTYININLERITTERSQDIVVGWEYNKDFDLSAEYTQVSPFKLGENEGTIVESKIIVKRKIEEENYLPIKQTQIEIEVPEYNGKKPEEVTVQATKLMATKGEDLGNVIFSEDNWNYSGKKITIVVTNENNGKAVNSNGEDEFVITYRYNEYTENQNITLGKNIKATVEEYSANKNKITTKEIKDSQENETKPNDIMTYNIGTTEEKINKAKINANYNSIDTVYETEFTTTVNVNILTSDLLEEIKIDSSKEIYLDNKETEYDASLDVYYNKIKFNYAELKNILQNGATIEIQSVDGNILYTLNSESVKDEDSCEIKFDSKQQGIYVVFNEVTTNGSVAIEFTKAIGKSSYNKFTFNNFKKIKSKVYAEIKYEDYEKTHNLAEISVNKEFENSKTVAEISLTNDNLITSGKNDNVEVKIALNNDKQNTDLYMNPSFELVFPKYVKNVTVESANLMYENNLKIEECQAYNENGIAKVKINLSGIQTAFSDSIITNGANILLTLDIELDEYTPRKQDQIKMYYCNEGVTNYESQTKWSISKQVPNGIIRDTNGFDVAVVNYQAQSGMITANSIINYDGQASKISSVAQGEKTANIEVNKSSQIATMELVAMNNTGNKCTDVVFLGRVPFKGNKNVIDGKDLGTTVNVKILNGIQENIQNPNMVTIYYSTNENATKDLQNSQNEWTTNTSNWQEIKSYMIVVKGEMAPGTVLKYIYDFEIPGELNYDEAIFGSFGGYYNNNHKDVVSYEATEADKVGVITQNRPEVENITEPGLHVVTYPFGQNDNIYYGQILTVSTKVVNNTQDNIENATLKVSVPSGTVYTELDYYTLDDAAGVFQRYIDNSEVTEKEFTINNLNVGEVKVFNFQVKVLGNENNQNVLEGYSELNGIKNNYKLKAHKGKMSINAEILGGNSKFREGSEVLYDVYINKETTQELKDLKLEFKLPDYIELTKIAEFDGEKYTVLEYTTQDRKIIVDIGNQNSERKNIVVIGTVKDLGVQVSAVETIFNVYETNEKNKVYSSNVASFATEKMFVDVIQTMNSNEYKYGDTFEYKINVENKSDVSGYIDLKNQLPTNFDVENAKMFIDGQEEEIKPNNTMYKYEKLSAHGKLEIIATGTIVDIDDENKDLNLTNIVKVKLPGKEEVKSNPIIVKINKIEELEENVKVFEEDDKIDEEELDELEKLQEEALDNEEISEETLEDEEYSEETYEEEDIEEEYYEEYEDKELEEDDEYYEEDYEEEIETYSISGNVYLDSDKDGIKTNMDTDIDSSIKVQLQKDSSILKETTTDENGDYLFEELVSGDYKIIYNYDKEKLEHKSHEIEDGKAITDTITITNDSIENVDAGLQEKDKFDLQIKQYISSAVVNINGEEEEYIYDNLELAKIEIDPLQIKDASVKLKYKIIVTNTGNVEGQVSSIVNYIPNGMIFDQRENQEWSVGAINGNIYYDGLKGITIAPGECKEIELILNKKMTESNTGVVSNKVQIAYAESETRLAECIEGNFATQETIITITQGSSFGLKIVITTISFAGMIGLFAYMVKNGQIDLKLKGKKLIKKVYR